MQATGTPAPGDLKEHSGDSNPKSKEVFRDAMSLDTRDTGEGLCQVGQAEKESFYCLRRLNV